MSVQGFFFGVFFVVGVVVVGSGARSFVEINCSVTPGLYWTGMREVYWGALVVKYVCEYCHFGTASLGN